MVLGLYDLFSNSACLLQGRPCSHLMYEPSLNLRPYPVQLRETPQGFCDSQGCNDIGLANVHVSGETVDLQVLWRNDLKAVNSESTFQCDTTLCYHCPTQSPYESIRCRVTSQQKASISSPSTWSGGASEQATDPRSRTLSCEDYRSALVLLLRA